MKISKTSLYTVIVGLSVMTLIVSNIASTKLFDFFGTGLVLDGGAIIFPISYILGDIMTELYGFKGAKRIIYITFLMTLLASIGLYLVQLLPPGAVYENQSAFEAVLGFMPRIVFASLIAFLFGQLMNSYVFVKIREKTGEKSFWIRALGSSVIGNLLDTLIFTTLAFIGTIPTADFVGLLILAYITKMVGEIVLYPITISVLKLIKKHVKSDEAIQF